MSLWHLSIEAGRRLLKWFRLDRRRRVLENLCREYAEEMESSLRLEWHAEQMRYPQFCERLLRIANDEKIHRNEIAEMLMRSDPQAAY
jgi:hypothetical protein